MTPASLTTVLFDLDDTLIDSFGARVEALRRVFVGVGINSPSATEFIRDLRGEQLGGALKQLGVKHGLESDMSEQYLRMYWTKVPKLISLYPGIQPMLEEFSDRGLKLGVVTQKTRSFEVERRPAGAVVELGQLGVAELFSVVVGYEDVEHHKPDPEGLQLALSRLRTSPEEALFVGDATADILAAISAGCWSCHATWGTQVTGCPIEPKPHFVSTSPSELQSLVLCHC